MRVSPAALFGLGLGLGLGAGCEPEPDRLWINEIQVLGEEDFGYLDVEVHLFDARTDEHLGCAGQSAGLESVDQSGVTYELEAFFMRNGRRVEPLDLAGRDVVLQVIEDDVSPCPAVPSLAEDDPVGTSGPIAGEALGEAGTISFGNVARLTLALYP